MVKRNYFAPLNFICRMIPLAFLLLLSLPPLSGCEKKAPPQKAPEAAKPSATILEAIKPGEINLKETRLATIPEDYDKWSNITFSADGQQAFYKARKKDREFIVVSSTGGENTGPAYESISWLVASLDGRRFAFGGGKGGKKYLVVDNKEQRDLYHEEVAPSSFSPNGRFVACEVGGLKEKKWFIFVSDGEKEVYRSRVYSDTFRPPVFSPDGRLLVYELGKMDKERTVFFLDVSAGKIIKERLYTDYQTGKFSFSSDSSRVIYNVQKEGKNFLVLHDFALNEERKIELPYASSGQFVLSPDGKQIPYIVTKEGKQYLVVSPWENPERGKEYGPYDAITSPIFGPGSTIATYNAVKEGKWRSVVGDREGAKYDGIGGGAPPVFSSDGAKIAYPAMKNGKWFMVVSPAGKPSAVKEGPAYDMVVTPVFSPDGKYIAYRVRRGSMENAERFIVIADTETGKVIKEGQTGDEIWPPVWSADNKAAAYGARIGRELWWKVETLGE
jgi:Tol biopolymer transport system component